MLTKFWETIGSNLAERWVAVSVPALVFWFGGLLAWLYSQGGVAGLQQPLKWLGQQPTPTQIGVLLALLLGVVASGEIVAEITTPALRLMEGYWPALLEPLRERRVGYVEERVKSLDEKFQELAGPVQDRTATPQERAEYVRIDRQLRRFPAKESYQPTTVGNILRAAESRPVDKYGLDAVAVWPHLWLLLPNTVQSELAAARRSLNAAVGACLWGLLFLAFAPWAWWAALVGLGVTLVAFRFWVPSRAEMFADLVEAVFDLYRTTLYSQLRWPLPTDPRAERIVGQHVTMYLVRGLDDDKPTFTTPTSNEATPDDTPDPL
jgi:hypothetical protein